jgi:hypothetical protein
VTPETEPTCETKLHAAEKKIAALEATLRELASPPKLEVQVEGDPPPASDKISKLRSLLALIFPPPVRRLAILLILTAVWISLVIIVDDVVISHWNQVVKSRNFTLISICSAALIFLCSWAETAISETKGIHINPWEDRMIKRRCNKRVVANSVKYAKKVTTHSEIFNPVVILANMIIVITYTTMLLPTLINNEIVYPAIITFPIFNLIINLHLKISDAFSGIGITIALFLIAELLPKQIAMKYRMGSLLLTAPWLVVSSAFLILPAYGMSKPISFVLSLRLSRDHAGS